MKTLATNLAGGFLLLILIVVGMQGSMILSGLAIGASVGLTLLIWLGADRLGIALVLLATFLAPINGLKLGAGGNVTFADFAYVLGFGLLVPRMLQSTSKMPRLYTWGVTLLTINALVVSLIAAEPIPSLAGFVRISWAVIVIPIVLHRLKPGRKLMNALAWAYVIGQIVSTAKGIISYGFSSGIGGGRGIGWTTHPNFFALGGQLAFALCVFLFYRTPREHRWIVVLAAFICGISVIQSGSRASLLCVVLIVLVWPLVERTAISYYVLLSFAGLAAVGLNFAMENAPEGSALARLQGGGTAGGSSLEREYLFDKGWALFWANPIKGNGWSTDILEYHNAYLEVAIGGGILALAAFGLILASMVKPLFDTPVPNRLAFAGLSYVVFAALGPTLYDRVLWGALALIYALRYDPDEKLEEGEARADRRERKTEPTPGLPPGRTLTPRRTR